MELFTLALPVIKSIAYAIVVLIVGLLLISWISGKAEHIIGKTKIDGTLKPFIISLIRALLKIFLVLAVIAMLGIDTTSFVAVLAAAGFAIGLAFQGSLSNFAGGVLLLVTRPIKVGDFIEANGYSGTVEAIQILYSQIVTLDNKVIHIPNGSLSNTSITNYSEKATRRVDFKFGAGYSDDYKKVIQILTEIVHQHPQALKTPEPFVRMSEHGDHTVFYTVRVWVNAADYWTVYFDVIEAVKKRFDEEKITIPFPQMDVHVSQQV